MVIKEKKQKNKDNKEKEEKREVGWELWCALKELLGYTIHFAYRKLELVSLAHYLTCTLLYLYIYFLFDLLKGANCCFYTSILYYTG